MTAIPTPLTADPNELRPGVVVPAFLRRYAGRYVLAYSAGVAFLLVTNWLTVTIPALIKDVFDALAKGADPGEIRTFCALIGAAAVAVIIVRTLSRVLFFNPGRTIEFRLRNDMLQRMLAMSSGWMRTQQTGDLVSRAINDATFVRSLVGFAVLQLLNVATATGFSFYMMVKTDAWLTLYCAVPLVLAFWVLREGTGRLYGAFVETQQELGRVSRQVLEAYNGVASIQAMVAEPAFLHRFDEHNERYTQLNVQVTALRVFVLPLASAMGNVCIFLLLLIGGQHAIDGHLTIGDIAAYASYAAILVSGLAMFGWVINSVQRGYVSLERCWEVARLEPDRPAGTATIATSGDGVAVHVQGLSFRYADAEPDEPDALTDIDFALPAGQTLGVYGPVGAGKTTLMQILSGIVQPTSGTVRLDGLPVATIENQSLRAAVAVVPQQAFLFSRSLRRNIAFVDDDTEVGGGWPDDARIAAAIEKACLAGEVARFPDGLDTIVGEKGLTLSGGQRQRTQLARAFYRGYRLLILDDVLSAVDHDTEERLLAAIRGALRSDTQRATGIIVSSRVSALADCDAIIVLQHGRIVARGTHQELANGDGLYAKAYIAQRDGQDS